MHPHQPVDQNRRRKDKADRCTDRQTRPATVLGRLLGLVDYLDLAPVCLGEDGGIIGAHKLLAVEFLERSRSAFASSTLSYSAAYTNMGFSLTLVSLSLYLLWMHLSSPWTVTVFAGTQCGGYRALNAPVTETIIRSVATLPFWSLACFRPKYSRCRKARIP